MAKMAKWRRHTVEFKRQAVERMKTCENTHELARELKIQRKLLYTWRYQFVGRPEAGRGAAQLPSIARFHKVGIARAQTQLAWCLLVLHCRAGVDGQLGCREFG
jgi:transposase-like protein